MKECWIDEHGVEAKRGKVILATREERAQPSTFCAVCSSVLQLNGNRKSMRLFPRLLVAASINAQNNTLTNRAIRETCVSSTQSLGIVQAPEFKLVTLYKHPRREGKKKRHRKWVTRRSICIVDWVSCTARNHFDCPQYFQQRRNWIISLNVFKTVELKARIV